MNDRAEKNYSVYQKIHQFLKNLYLKILMMLEMKIF